jgi:PAS domain S-box-containing protein
LVDDFETAFKLCQGVEKKIINETEIVEQSDSADALKLKYIALQKEFKEFKETQNKRAEQFTEILGNITWNESFKPIEAHVSETDPYYDLFETSKILQKDIKELFDIEKEINKSLNNIVLSKTNELIKKESNLRSIINNSDKLIWLLDKNFVLIEANNLFYEYFRKVIKKDIKIGDNLLNILNDTSLKKDLTLWLKDALSGKHAVHEYKHKINSITVTHEYNIFPVFENGTVEAISIRVVDISSKKQAERKLILQNEALKQVNSELDHFVYSVSHDLRAPLNSLMGLINLAKYEDNIETVKEYIALQEKSVTKLDDFIQDIINLSRNARTELTLEEIDLEKLFESIHSDLQYADNSSSVEFVLDVYQNIKLLGDRNRLRIIFSNLISNALRYADLRKERPLIKIQALVKENDVEVKVIDNGQGIKKEHQKKIFDIFYRANAFQNGSGLGLYILKESLKKINGKVSLKSEYGIGSTFTINFPHVTQNSKLNKAKISDF